MNNTKKLISILLAGATLGVAAPAFADSWRGNDRGHDRYSRFDHRDHRDGRDFRDHRDHRDYRPYFREVDRRRVVVVQQPYVVERQVPVYYNEPAPQPSVGLGAMSGAVIGGIYDSRQ